MTFITEQYGNHCNTCTFSTVFINEMNKPRLTLRQCDRCGAYEAITNGIITVRRTEGGLE